MDPSEKGERLSDLVDQSVELKVPKQPQTNLWLSTKLCDPEAIPRKLDFIFNKRGGREVQRGGDCRRITKQRHRWPHVTEESCSMELIGTITTSHGN